jgi:hypothetical protein
MEQMFLTPDDLARLTGRKRRSGQVRWLVEHGWRFEVDAYGRPIVLAAEAERRLSSWITQREPRLRLAS